MEALALLWYQWMLHNRLLRSWLTMLQARESHYAPSYYNDPHEALFKIQQQGSVNDYFIKFKRLVNHIVGLAPPFLLSCFISSLTHKLYCKVQTLQPLSLPQVVALAKLQEDKF